MYRVGTGGAKNFRPVEPLPPLTSDTRELEQTEYERFKDDVVAFFVSIGKRVKRLVVGGHSAERALSLFDSFRKESWDRIPDEYHRNIHDYHIGSVMELNRIGKIKQLKAGEATHEVLGQGTESVKQGMLGKISRDIQLTTIELAYRFLSEDRQLPKGFVDRALIPHFVEMIVKTYDVDREEAKTAVQEITTSEGLTKESRVTFERILEVKNRIRRLYNDEPDPERFDMDHPDNPGSVGKFNRDNPAGTLPVLAKPEFSRYELDAEDKQYIKAVVDSGKGLKIPRHDLINRLKRLALRNKKEGMMGVLSFAFSTVFTGSGIGVMAAASNAAYYLSYYLGWSMITHGIRWVRALRAIQRAQLASDFKLEGNEFEAITAMDEKKLRTFLRSLRYVCSQETLTRIYNSYAELEKDAERRLAMAAKNGKLDELIRLEEGKARYLHRRENLKKAFNLYDRLYVTATTDMKRMEREWKEQVDLLWNTKFRGMSKTRLNSLFNHAANDSRVTEKTYHLITNKTGWLKSIFPQLAKRDSLSEQQRELALSEYQAILDQELPDIEGSDEERELLNEQADKVAGVAHVARGGAGIYVLGWIKDAINTTLTHGLKVGWTAGFTDAPKLVFTPYLPKPSIEGLTTFGFFFLVDFVFDKINTRINKSRFKSIKSGKSQTTGIGSWQRRRTGREEVGTLRRLAKDDLPDFVEKVLKLHKYHKVLMEEMRLQKELSDRNPYARDYEYMDDYEAAVMILRRQKYEFWVQELMAGAVGTLHDHVQKKTHILDRRMADIIAGD